MKLKIIIGTTVILLIIFFYLNRNSTNPKPPQNQEKPDKARVVQISIDNINKNLFQTQIDPNYKWFSVGQGAYNKQYYSRDTFISFIGLSHSDELRPVLSHAIDWFSEHQLKDGYIPIWFQETQTEKLNLNVYPFAPYNLTEKDGAIRQIDHVTEFIHSIYLNYQVTKDLEWLKKRIVNAEKSWQYLESLTDSYLVVSPYSEFAGADWADLIRRNGKASFVNAYWYYVTNLLASMESVVGNQSLQEKYQQYSQNIKKEFNNNFWVVSTPKNCSLSQTGHYLSWRDKAGPHDYFELDGNSLAVASGLADDNQSQQILAYINNNFDYFVNQYGATRVLCGLYDLSDTAVKPGEYQNGAYWYIPSYFLVMAEEKYSKTDQIRTIWNRAASANIKFQEDGLTEWYYEDGRVGGALNYSWSLAFPIFVANLPVIDNLQ